VIELDHVEAALKLFDPEVELLGPEDPPVSYETAWGKT